MVVCPFAFTLSLPERQDTISQGQLERVGVAIPQSPSQVLEQREHMSLPPQRTVTMSQQPQPHRVGLRFLSSDSPVKSQSSAVLETLLLTHCSDEETDPEACTQVFQRPVISLSPHRPPGQKPRAATRQAALGSNGNRGDGG